MARFQRKQWLDDHVVPLLSGEPKLEIHHPFWNGEPPEEVLILLKPLDADDESAWPRACHRLIKENNFRFDLLREQQQVPMGNVVFILFGGDGAPLFNDEGFASIRLLRKEEDRTSLILQVGYKYVDVPTASAGVKQFFELFDTDPVSVCQRYASVFGQA